MIRFEILLPLFYNDGQAIERETFVEADDQLVQRFGATSTDTVVVLDKMIASGGLGGEHVACASSLSGEKPVWFPPAVLPVLRTAGVSLAVGGSGPSCRTGR